MSSVFRGASYQRGHGIGSFLGGMLRTVAPLFKSGAKAIGNEALRAGANILGDVVSLRAPPGQALRSRAKEFTGALKRRADEKLERVLMGGGSAYKKRRITRVTPQSIAALLRGHKSKRKSPKKKRKAPKRRTTPKKRKAPKRKTSKGKKRKTTKRKKAARRVNDIFG